MALAEDLTALGETDAALNIWKQVTDNHSYPRAKVQLAELYVAMIKLFHLHPACRPGRDAIAHGFSRRQRRQLKLQDVLRQRQQPRLPGIDAPPRLAPPVLPPAPASESGSTTPTPPTHSHGRSRPSGPQVSGRG